MQVILLERIEKLGQMGDVVAVKDGYARNFLLPQKKALRATDANQKQFESQRATLEAQNIERRTEAETVAERLNGQSFVLIRQAGDSGQLYGSVSTRDIADAAGADDVNLHRSQIVLDRPLKTLGLHDVRIVLHPEVSVSVTVNIARSEDEAERQARGEDVTREDSFEDEDAEAEAGEFFESDELAADAAGETAGDESGDASSVDTDDADKASE